MPRLPTPALESATGATAEVYAQIKKAVGQVPNTYAAIGRPRPRGAQCHPRGRGRPGHR